MFREKDLQELVRLAVDKAVPKYARTRDSYENTLCVSVNQSGDISLTITQENRGCAGATFVGAGGGHSSPLIKEALRLLALAIQQEARVLEIVEHRDF